VSNFFPEIVCSDFWLPLSSSLSLSSFSLFSDALAAASMLSTTTAVTIPDQRPYPTIVLPTQTQHQSLVPNGAVMRLHAPFSPLAQLTFASAGCRAWWDVQPFF